MNDLGIKIKNIREEKKITKSELARLIDVSPAYITMLENGKKQNPSRAILDKIAEALGVAIYELLPVSEDFQEALAAALEFYNPNNKFQEIRSKFAESKEFCLFDIECKFNSVILEILASANESTTLGYKLSDFSAEEVDEIINFVFNSYKLKINEILERHKKDALLLNEGIKLANSKLSKKDLSYIETLSPEDQSILLEYSKKIANKVLKKQIKEK